MCTRRKKSSFFGFLLTNYFRVSLQAIYRHIHCKNCECCPQCLHQCPVILKFVTSTTSGAGVKLFSLVSKNSSNNVYFTTLVVVVVVVTPPHSTNQHHHSTGIPPSQTAIKITTTARLSPIKNRLSRNQLCRYLRCFVPKSVQS